jgi:hypothetical protein
MRPLSARIVSHEIGIKAVWYIFVLLGSLINAGFNVHRFRVWITEDRGLIAKTMNPLNTELLNPEPITIEP